MRIALFLIGFWAFVASLVGSILATTYLLPEPYSVIAGIAPVAIGVSLLLAYVAAEML